MWAAGLAAVVSDGQDELHSCNSELREEKIKRDYAEEDLHPARDSRMEVKLDWLSESPRS